MNKGFTLVELLVSIAVMGIVATGSLVMINPAGQLQKGRDAKRKADLQQIRSALELYRSDNGSYPSSLPACGSALTYSGTTYLKSVPCDPKSSEGRTYDYRPVGSPAVSYEIVSCVERRDSSENQSNIAPCAGRGSSFSFKVDSP